MAETGKIKKISFDELRALLQQGLGDILAALPRGRDPVVDLTFLNTNGFVPLDINGDRERIELVHDFAGAVRDLRITADRSLTDIERLMADGLAVRIVAGDETWHQEFID